MRDNKPKLDNKPKPNLLFDMLIEETSLVPYGANDRTFFLRKVAKMNPDTLNAILATGLDNEEAFTAFCAENEITGEAADALRCVLQIIAAYREALPDNVVGVVPMLAGVEASAEGEMEKDETPPEPAVDMVPKADYDKVVSELAEVTKAAKVNEIPEEAKPFVEQFQKEADARADEIKKAHDRIAELEAAHRRSEFVQKAAEFSELPMEAGELGAIMQGISDHDEALYPKLESLLKAVNESIKESALFKSVGSSEAPEIGTAEAKIYKKAEELVAKSGGSMTKQQAIAKVASENPDLYNEYNQEG